MQHIVCHVLFKFDRTEIASINFQLYFIDSNKQLMQEGRKPEHPRKPLTMSFRELHIIQPKNLSPIGTRTRCLLVKHR